MTISIRFVDAPPNLVNSNSLYVRLIEAATGVKSELVSDAKAHVDLDLVSVHAPEVQRLVRTLTSVMPGKGYRGRLRRHERWNAVYREPSPTATHAIWFTGDNVRPPIGSWDGYLSFDLDPLEGKNVYFPHWWEYLGLLSSTRASYSGVELSVEMLMSMREPESTRPRFACAFIGNPTPMRFHAVEALERLGQVDVYGNSVGRPIASKVDVAKNYRFVLCFENDLYPGYVTEKVFEAWGTGAIPLWWGSDPARYVNPEAVINAAEYSCLADFASAVADVNKSGERWSHMAASPILLRQPDLNPTLELLSGVLSR